MLDHLHEHDGVEPGQSGVPVGQGGLDQPQPRALPVGQPVELETAGGGGKRPDGYVGADDLGERRLGQQEGQQRAVAAAEVGDATGTGGAQHGQDRAVTLPGQRHRAVRLGTGAEPCVR